MTGETKKPAVQPAEQQARRLELRDFSDNMIKLLVGPARIVLQVHEQVLSSSSRFLQNALKPEWKSLRDEPLIIDLTRYELVNVRLYIHWLYARDLPVLDGAFISWTLANAFIFGEEIMDIDYKNAVLRSMVMVFKKTPDVSMGSIKVIYLNTAPGSPARRLMADICAHMMVSKRWMNKRQGMEGLTHEILLDVLVAVEPKYSWDQRPWQGSVEEYLEIEKN